MSLYVQLVRHLLKKYNSLNDWSNCETDDQKRVVRYELQRICEVEFVIKFLSRDEKLKLSDSSISSLKDEIDGWRGRNNPKYRDALNKLLNLIK